MSRLFFLSSKLGMGHPVGIVAVAALAVLLLGGLPPAGAQDLDFVLWQELTAVRSSDTQWGDIDQDGDLDLVMSGLTSAGNRITNVYENQDGSLVHVQSLPGISSESGPNLALGDYDGDGDLDLALAGLTDPSFGESDGERIARVYRNDGSGTFTWDTAQTLTGVGLAAVAWGDYDNDGDPDLVITGHDGTQRLSILYKNDPTGTLTPDPSASLTGLSAGSAGWADFDRDGDMDLVLTGGAGPDDQRAILYENDPVGTLTDEGSHGLPGVALSDVAWGDFDNDGDLDVAVTGVYSTGHVARIYTNDGAGNFTYAHSVLDDDVYRSSCAWGDYDNDGDLDVAFCGYDGVSVYTVIYRNMGGSFAAAHDLERAYDGSMNWADVDQDGDLDFFLTGTYYGWHEHAMLYRNVGATPNTAPSAPSDLDAPPGAPGLHLTWSGASDAETPTAGLYYCLRVGTSPGACDVLSGCYGTPLMGNLGQCRDLVLDVPPGRYYWSVRAIDSGLLASPWSEEAVGFYCPYDLDGDAAIGLGDVAALLANYGHWGMDYADGEFTGDGLVGCDDLAILLGVYGTECP